MDNIEFALQRLREIIAADIKEESALHNSAHKEIWQIVLRGDMEGVAFLDILFRVFRVWDDLIDRDRPVDENQINGAFWEALVELPQNMFYHRHFTKLNTTIASIANMWFDANQFERSGDGHQRRISFVLRNVCNDIIIQCAYLVGGYGWMRCVSPHVREFVHNESFESYLKGLAQEEN